MNTPSSQTATPQSAHNSEQLSPYFPNLLSPLDLGFTQLRNRGQVSVVGLCVTIST